MVAWYSVCFPVLVIAAESSFQFLSLSATSFETVPIEENPREAKLYQISSSSLWASLLPELLALQVLTAFLILQCLQTSAFNILSSIFSGCKIGLNKLVCHLPKAEKFPCSWKKHLGLISN